MVYYSHKHLTQSDVVLYFYTVPGQQFGLPIGMRFKLSSTLYQCVVFRPDVDLKSLKSVPCGFSKTSLSSSLARARCGAEDRQES